jgi:hypothetical protein
MSAFDTNLVDRIVRDVIARLRDGDRGASSTPAAPDVLVLDEPVLTEASLVERVDGHRVIVIGRRTVLTPTARDFLRKREIAFTRLGDAVATSRSNGHADRLAIVAVESNVVASTVVAMGWREARTNCWEQATRDAVEALRSGMHGVVVFTDQDAAVGCLANRNRDVRAAIVDDAHGVRAAREMIGPNLLVVDPLGKTFVEMRGILREFAAGSTTPPTGWED